MSEVDTTQFDPDQSEMETCPACGFHLRLDPDVVLGEVLWCDNCGVELEVVSLQPIRVDLFEEEEK